MSCIPVHLQFAFATLFAAASVANAQLQPGDVPPDLLGYSKSGDRIQVSDFKGKVVAVSFWAYLAHDPAKKAYGGYKVKGIPHLVIISRDGTIKQVFSGHSESNLKHVVGAVAAALGG